jgi:hypothetical protein
MSWFLFLALPVLVIGGLIALAAWLEVTYSSGWTFVVGGLAFLLFFSCLMLGINQAGRDLEVESCRNWGLTNSRPTKFVSYSWWSYNCATPDGKGHWIPVDQVIVNTPEANG